MCFTNQIIKIGEAMYLFNLYRPTNNENECITDDPDALVGPLPSIQDLYPDTPEDILEEIMDICEMRCEYNRELITFFTSAAIPLDEKVERLLSFYPHAKTLITKENSKFFFKEFIECCTYDLKFFYHFLPIISAYNEKQLPKDFPIFFELSNCVKNCILTKQERDKKLTGSKASKYQKQSDQTSEIPTLQYIFKKLKPYVESVYQEKFESYFDITSTRQGLAYELKPNINTQHAALQQKLTDSKKVQPKILSKINALNLHTLNCNFNLLLELKKLEFAIILNHEKGDNLQLKLQVTKMEFIKQCRDCNNAVESTTHTETWTHIRNFFHKVCQLEKNIEDNLLELNTATQKQESIIKIIKESALVSASDFEKKLESELNFQTDHEEKHLGETKCVQENLSFLEADPSEEDILQIYAEFKQKKLKQQSKHTIGKLETKQDTLGNTILASDQQVLSKLINYNLQSNHIQTLQDIFRTPIPHYQITWKALETLIQKCGGYIYDDTGASRRIIRLYSMSTLVDGVCVNQRGIHQSHHSGHNETTVSRWTIKIFKEALERAGIQEEIVKILATIEKPKPTLKH